MNRLISIAIMMLALSQTSMANLIPEGNPITSWNEQYTLYRLEQDGIHYYFIYGPFDDGSGIQRSTYQFYLMYHDEDVQAPEIVEIPSEFKWDGDLRKVEGFVIQDQSFENVNINFSEKELTFNKISFPKDVYPPCAPDGQGNMTALSYKSRFTKTVNVREFIVNEDNPVFKAVDGVLMSKTEDVIIRYPVCRKSVNYYIPESVKTLTEGAFNGVKTPVFLNGICKETPYEPAFHNYPFMGLYDRNGVSDNCFYLKNTNIKAQDHVDIEVFPKNAVALSFLPYEVGMSEIIRNRLRFEKYIFSNIYNTPEKEGVSRTVEFTYPDDVTIIISNSMDDSTDAVFDDVSDLKKVTTYVNAAQEPRFEKMFENRNFPQNALIETTKDILYLYPELCHGDWIDKQTQFIYGLCRFGDSELTMREWSTDNVEIATIDENGLLTAYQTGQINVTLLCTDNYGNKYEASELIYITETDLTQSGLIATKQERNFPQGVYNMHGIRVGDSIEGLPKGMYISSGAKIAIR